MNLQKLLSQRDAVKRFIERLLEKIEAAKADSAMIEFGTILETLEDKSASLEALNEKILNQRDTEDMGEEIISAEEYKLDLEIQLRKLREFRSNNNQTRNNNTIVSRNTSPVRSENNIVRNEFENNSQTERQGMNFSSQNGSNFSFNSGSSQFYRLPKLTLPKFCGDILMWQTFWDSFESTVHLNVSLSDIQKFNYLKSQLESEAARTIEGFTLTNANYRRAVDLLQERYGQQHKITHASMQALLQLPSPKNTVHSLRQFYDKMESHIRSLESMGQFQETYGCLLVPIVLDKLPGEIRKHLARQHGDTNWRMVDLRQALKNEINIMEAGISGGQPEVEDYVSTASFFAGARSRRRRPDVTALQRSEAQNRPKCAFCKEQHVATECRKYATAVERVDVVKKERLCFNCLGKHNLAQCRSNRRCQKCHIKHHTSICQTQATVQPMNPTRPEVPIQQPEVPTQPHVTPVLHLSNSQFTHSEVLLKTATATVTARGIYATAAVLFDEGAQRSFITKQLADELQIQADGTEQINLSSFGGNSSKVQHLDTATIHLLAGHNQKIPVRVLVVPQIATPMQNCLKTAIDTYPYLRNLTLAHHVSHDHKFDISLLIGADFYWDFVEDEIIRGDGPTAVRSKLGYLLSGPINGTRSSETTGYIMNVLTSPVSIDSALEKFWSLESIGITPISQDHKAEEYLQTYQNTSIEYLDGRYYAKLPWKHDHATLPTNYNIAKKRTENTIRRLASEPEILQKYTEIITDQEKRGFIEVVPEHDHTKPRQVHYIPHHHVKKESLTTPVRIVYDCSCRQSRHYPSLNDCLESTPPILNELTLLLTRFRLHSYAVSTDIEKAFLHIGLHEDDRDMTRFFWIDPENPYSPMITYRFRAVLFGATCSPFILNAVILKHLELNKDVSASHIIERDLYVDNVISSFPTEKEACTFFQESRALMSTAGMNLRSWTSNSATLRTEAKRNNILDTDDNPKILGLRWKPDNDMLSFVKRYIPQVPDVTKRFILKYSSQIYDPLGILSPVTIRAKVLLQEIWKLKLDWDVILPSDIQQSWNKLADDLNSTVNYTFPRRLLPSNHTGSDKHTYLHVFTDASIKAYGTTAYLSDAQCSTLVMAKTRVAPLKRLTLPQLELMAALTGARLAKHLQSTLNADETIFWTDSQIVLYWIGSSKPMKTFVKNRVSEIQELTNIESWQYCPTSENPANLLTRGITAEKFYNSTLWKRGPDWLPNPKMWPTWQRNTASLNTIVEEYRTDSTSNQQTTVCTEFPKQTRSTDSDTSTHHVGSVIDISRFSSYKKALRITAYVKRFIENCKKCRQMKTIDSLSAYELCAAEKVLLRLCQEDEFQRELQSLKSSTHKSKLELIRQLRLFLDNSGLIRCGGRLHNAPIEEDAKFPILLPRRHTLTKLIVQDAHATHLHAGMNATVAYVRQKYWVPAIRQCVKSIIHKCVSCRRVIGKPYLAPEPPPLPKSRVQDLPPFCVTGVDFAGPLHLKPITGNENKAYICLFTCAATRAIHLETVSDLSADTFVRAFRRFTSRKSIPTLMLSDNAATFTASASYLQKLSQEPAVKVLLNDKGIDWQFIPKRAPWFGGFWERMVGLTKVTLKKILGRSCIDFDTLQTVIIEIEALLNDRPLTHVSSDLDDLEPLTPSQLLYGRRILSLPYSNTPEEVTLTNVSQSITKRAKVLQHLLEQFRQRWRQEYLTALREYHRNSGVSYQSIRVGDVVQVHDDCPRTRWKLAVVQELLPGNDGITRAARIRTCHGCTTRPIVKLYPLEIPQENSDITKHSSSA